MPTAVLIRCEEGSGDSIRAKAMALRALFESEWRELPLVFAIAPGVTVHGIPLSQHLSNRAPVGEAELCRVRNKG
jgi:hypothetical protein